MNLLGFLHLILLYAWPTPIFLKNVTPHRSEVFPLWDGISNFIFSHPPPPPPAFLFCSAAADMSWFIIKRQAKKPLRIFPELRTYNSNVALWHSLCEKKVTELTIHFYRCSYVFKIPGKYQWWLMVSFDWVRQQEAWEYHKAAYCRQRQVETFQFSCRISWAIYKRVDLSAERRAWCGTKMKAVGGFNTTSEADKFQ